MRVCCLFSGGKDSSYSLHRMLLSGFEVPVLLTMRSADPDSWLYQTPGMEASHMFHELTGIETRVVHSPVSRELEKEVLSGALKVLKDEFDLDAVCSGALMSDYQRMAFTDAACDAGLVSFTPLWRKDGRTYMKELLELGFRFILLSYSSEGFGDQDLGRVVEEADLERFFSLSDRWRSHPAFEGGEAETLVLEAPLYKRRMEVEGCVIKDGPCRARFVLNRMVLV
ncbi:MAG: diphthine--ammonia ligase [Candidatus Thermoplasmatota archaeon]|nr:diphthine--ammonia ligase [Candidatus Thermoplasmatota archaeon]